jgi:hypothetical protein
LMGEIFKNKMFVNQLASHIKKKKTGRLWEMFYTNKVLYTSTDKSVSILLVDGEG